MTEYHSPRHHSLVFFSRPTGDEACRPMMDLRTRTLGLQTALARSTTSTNRALVCDASRLTASLSPALQCRASIARRLPRGITRPRRRCVAARAPGAPPGDRARVEYEFSRRAPELFVAARCFACFPRGARARTARDGEGRGRGRPTTRLRGPRRARDARVADASLDAVRRVDSRRPRGRPRRLETASSSDASRPRA